MSKIEQLRKRQAKLEKQIVQEEANEKTGLKTRYVLAGGSIIDYCPLVLCPICGEETGPMEGQLSSDRDRWTYFWDRCYTCDTEFRIGRVSEKCALCHEPFFSDPYHDVNQYDHHRCEKDGRSYCTPCYMQLFFDGYIDLSSDNPELTDDTGRTALYSVWPTHVGNTVAPYRSRLITNGYEEVAVVKEWAQVGEICCKVVAKGRRYLVLGAGVVDPREEYCYIIYQNGGKAQALV